MDFTRRVALQYIVSFAAAGSSTVTRVSAADDPYTGYNKLLQKYRAERLKALVQHLKKVSAFWRKVETKKVLRKAAQQKKKPVDDKLESYVTDAMPRFTFRAPPEIPRDMPEKIRKMIERDQAKFIKSAEDRAYEEAAEQAARWRKDKDKTPWPEETAGIPRFSPVVHLRAMQEASKNWGYVINTGPAGTDEDALAKTLDEKLHRFFHPAKSATLAEDERKALWKEITAAQKKLGDETAMPHAKREKLFFARFIAALKTAGVPADYAGGILAVEATNKGMGWYQSGTLGSFIPASTAIGYAQIIGESFFDFLIQNEKKVMLAVKALPQAEKLIAHLESKVFPEIKKSKFEDFRLKDEGRAVQALLSDIQSGPLVQTMFMADSWEALAKNCRAGEENNKLLTPAFAELANLLGLKNALQFARAPKGAVAANFVTREELEKNFHVLSAGDVDAVLAQLGNMMKRQVLNYKTAPDATPGIGPKFAELYAGLGGDPKNFDPHKPVQAIKCALRPDAAKPPEPFLQNKK